MVTMFCLFLGILIAEKNNGTQAPAVTMTTIIKPDPSCDLSHNARVASSSSESSVQAEGSTRHLSVSSAPGPDTEILGKGVARSASCPLGEGYTKEDKEVIAITHGQEYKMKTRSKQLVTFGSKSHETDKKPVESMNAVIHQIEEINTNSAKQNGCGPGSETCNVTNAKSNYDSQINEIHSAQVGPVSPGTSPYHKLVSSNCVNGSPAKPPKPQVPVRTVSLPATIGGAVMSTFKPKGSTAKSPQEPKPLPTTGRVSKISTIRDKV